MSPGLTTLMSPGLTTQLASQSAREFPKDLILKLCHIKSHILALITQFLRNFFIFSKDV